MVSKLLLFLHLALFTVLFIAAGCAGARFVNTTAMVSGLVYFLHVTLMPLPVFT